MLHNSPPSLTDAGRPVAIARAEGLVKVCGSYDGYRRVCVASDGTQGTRWAVVKLAAFFCERHRESGNFLKIPSVLQSRGGVLRRQTSIPAPPPRGTIQEQSSTPTEIRKMIAVLEDD